MKTKGANHGKGQSKVSQEANKEISGKESREQRQDGKEEMISIVDAVKGNGRAITVGNFEIRELDAETVFIEVIDGEDQGEGASFDNAQLAEVIEQFYRENF